MTPLEDATLRYLAVQPRPCVASEVRPWGHAPSPEEQHAALANLMRHDYARCERPQREGELLWWSTPAGKQHLQRNAAPILSIMGAQRPHTLR
jgi:hypothetical protein